VGGDGATHLGAPTVAGASVRGVVVRQGRAKKVVVYKIRRRKGYRRKQGHRQGFTEVRIEGVDAR
jgi:large subunit ribosomal protein L21